MKEGRGSTFGWFWTLTCNTCGATWSQTRACRVLTCPFCLKGRGEEVTNGERG